MVLTLLLMNSSCKTNVFSTNDFKEVDFKNGQKIQLVTNNEVYNIFVTFNEGNDFTLKYLPEATEVLLGTTVIVKGDKAEISSGELKFSKDINEFNNSFIPKIIYLFFKNTSFEKENFVYNKTENCFVLTKSILEKNVVFTVQLAQNKQSQIYIFEIRWEKKLKTLNSVSFILSFFVEKTLNICYHYVCIQNKGDILWMH